MKNDVAEGKVVREEEVLTEAEEKIYMASQWQLMYRRFKKNRMAIIAGIVLLMVYFVAIFAKFVGPYDATYRNSSAIYVPPQKVHFIDEDNNFHMRPFVYGLEQHIDMESFRKTYTINEDEKHKLYFFVRGQEYNLFGFIPMDMHLFGAGENNEEHVFLFGTDGMGRDMFSRIAFGARISMSIGLLGVLISFVLGITIGGISGYFGGILDTIIQRIIEILRSIPKIPLWMALSAALPPHWPQLRIYFGITVILSLTAWVGLARVVRGKFLSLREEEYVMAAKTSGSSEMRIIRRHLFPAFLSHIIASLTLSIPRMILGETSLSFLGIGLRAPLISWGVLLKQAQNARTVALHPWLLLPGVFVIIAILSFNFAGDGVRDAADPYGS